MTKQALEPEFFDVAAQPTAVFAAEILQDSTGNVADGTLTLRGVAQPIARPFTLEMNGTQAKTAGTVTLDRRDFGMGPS